MQRMIAKALQGYWRLSRGLTMGAQAVVFDEAGRVCLIRHTYRDGWHFPGGGVEKRETVRQALARELSEEAALALTGEPELFAIYSNAVAFPADHIALFVVRRWRQDQEPKPNGEIAEHGWFAPDALPTEAIQPVRDRLAEIAGAEPVSEHWYRPGGKV